MFNFFKTIWNNLHGNVRMIFNLWHYDVHRMSDGRVILTRKR